MQRHLAAAILVAAALACRAEPTSRTVHRSPSAPAAAESDAVDRLRALGYVGFSPNAGGRLSGVVRRDPGSYPGYNLFTTPHLCSATLVDEAGAVKNFWQQTPCGRWSHAEMTPEGDLLALGIEPGDLGGPDELAARRFLMKLSWQGRLAWKRRLPAHHEVEVTSSGRLLTIVNRLRKLPEVSGAAAVRDNEVALLSPEGVVLESVSLYDAWRASPAAPPLQPVTLTRPGAIDLFHANSADLLPGGDVLVTVRHQDVVVALDWTQRRITWEWGRGELSGPHDGRLLPNGHLLAFDNGLSRRRSRIVEVDRARRRIVWQYEAPTPEDFFTVSRGSSQRLPNGNTLVAQSDSGRAFEVTREGALVWEFWNPFRNEQGERASIVRMRRIERMVVEQIVRRWGEGRRPARGRSDLSSPGGAGSSRRSRPP